MSAVDPNKEVVWFQTFAKARFRSEHEAAHFIGGRTGSAARLDSEAFAEVLQAGGFHRPTEPLFEMFADKQGTVSVKDLLFGCGLPAKAESKGASYSVLSDDVASTEDTFTRRSPSTSPILSTRDIMPSIRDIGTRPPSFGWTTTEVTTEIPNHAFEELRREVAHLIQKSLEESMGRKRFEESIRRDISDLKAEVWVAEKGLANVGERDAALEKEKQTRRIALLQEKQIRSSRDEALEREVSMSHQFLAIEIQALKESKSSMTAQIEDLTKLLHREEQERRALSIQMSESIETVRLATRTEVRERRYTDEVQSKHEALLKGVIGSVMQEVDKELSESRNAATQFQKNLLVDTDLLQEKLRLMLNEEARLRERAVETEAKMREVDKAHFEQCSQTVVAEERALYDALEHQIEAEVIDLQQKIKAEASKLVAQDVETLKVVECLRSSTAEDARQFRTEFEQAQKGIEMVRSRIVDDQVRLEESNTKLLTKIGSTETALRKEQGLREADVQKLSQDIQEVTTKLQLLSDQQGESQLRIAKALQDEFQLRQDTSNLEKKLRDQDPTDQLAEWQEADRRMFQVHEEALVGVERRTRATEAALGVHENAMTERFKGATARMAELEELITEYRGKVQESLLHVAELKDLKEFFLAERAKRMEDNVAMEIANNEQKRSLEELQALQLAHKAHVDDKIQDMMGRIAKETKDRANECAEVLKGVSEERVARAEAQMAERHLLQEMLGRTEEALNKSISEERHERRAGDTGLHKHCNQLMSSIEESRQAQAKATREAIALEARDRQAADNALTQTIAEATTACDTITKLENQFQATVQNDVQNLKTLVQKESLRRDASDERMQAMIEKESQSRQEALAREAQLRHEGHARASQAVNEAIMGERQARERGDLRLENQMLEIQLEQVDSEKFDAKSSKSPVKLQDDLASLHRRLAELHKRMARAKNVEAQTLDAVEACDALDFELHKRLALEG